MFYYISFLRPPPLRASATFTEPILITPQVCNDLRTEYFDNPIDIYYAWSFHRPSIAPNPLLDSGPESHLVITKPTKLTTWSPSTAYKEISVPRPSQRNDSVGSQWTDTESAWQLILTCGPAQIDQAILLGETETTGRRPFAIWSMPVIFPQHVHGGKAGKNVMKAKSAKQERIMRSYALRVPLRDHPITFNITEQTSFDLDKKIWDSGIGLSSWLVQIFSGKRSAWEGRLRDLYEALFSTDTRNILELGAGTGIVAITLCVLRSTLDLSDQPGSIVATDLPSAIPILQDNITSNHYLVSKCTPQAAVLDWEDRTFAPPVQAQLDSGLDVIVMADVTYNTTSFPALIAALAQLIERSQRARHGQSPLVLLGYKERHPDERALWDDVKAIGLSFQQIAQVDGAGGNPVEIWLG